MISFVAYYRVSTLRQGRSGLGIEAQQAAVAALVAGRGELLADFTEFESSRKDQRPALMEAIELCRRRKAVLVIAKLDRLARDVFFVSRLMKQGIEFQAADMPEANRLTVHVMAAFAEHEREAISKRTREALAAYKRRGGKLGNPRPDMVKATAAAAERAAVFRAETLRRVAPIVAGKKLRAAADALNAMQVPTLNGGRWHPQSVARLLQPPSASLCTHV